MDAIDILLVVAGVGYILVRRVIGDLVQVKNLLILPAVLTVVGLFQLQDIHRIDLATVAFVTVSIGASIVIGLLRGLTVHLGQRGDELWMRYRASTIVLWVLNFVVKAALYPLELLVSKDASSAVGHSLLLSIGLGILAESVVVLYRALHREGVVVWAKGDDGRAHRPSPAFDAARARVRSGVAPSRRGLVPTVTRDW